MTTNATFVVVFYSFYETKAKNNNEHALFLSSIFLSYIAKHNDKLPHSLSSSAIQKKKKNIKRKNLEEDDEPSDSSSSSATQEKNP
jgi:hypothetical protein